ncbi:sugar kinase [Acuticoccus mangrovi]|uniref:Sugar kinase n=1 Tax=Acuticoccus mangrovi TaxID=2796142 RepID=A0A934IRM8_9HYPH|nr:sugar kinase [Acuticoccus mangrovi]MBJ3777383.1 sugar kinase [Acuticoccus mangrovi]
MDIVALGEPLVEFNQQTDGRWLEGFGGDTSNVAIAAARQGAETAMIARIGTDEFGDGLMRLWAEEGVATDFVTCDPHAPTGIYFVHHGEGGHVFSYRRAGSAASLMRPEDVPAEAIRAAKVLHLSGISQAISASAADACFAAMRIAREAGVKVAYDLNLRSRLWPLERARAVIHGAMAYVDIALPGLDDAKALTGLDDPREIVAFYQRLGPSVVALTLGEGGALVADGDALYDVPPRTTTLVDASGAGDCFDGSFLAAWLRDGSVAAAAHYANTAASLSVEGYGAIAPIPTRAAVEAALALT